MPNLPHPNFDFYFCFDVLNQKKTAISSLASHFDPCSVKTKVMATNLTSLYRDIWSNILPRISGDDLGRLTLLTPSLSAILWRSASDLHIDWKRGWVDLERCLNGASRYESLSSLRVIATTRELTLAKRLFDPQKLPSSLLSLQLCFSASLHLFLLAPPNLATLTPNLLRLELHSISPSFFVLGCAHFPPKLETLILNHTDSNGVSRLKIMPGDIALLPRSITSLELRGCVCKEDAFSVSDWMPGLTSLTLASRSGSYLHPYHLPRTLISLDLEIHILTRPRTWSSTDHEFPWRIYFPRLVNLRLYFILNEKVVESVLSPVWLKPKDDFNQKHIEPLPADPSAQKQDLKPVSYRSIYLNASSWRDLSSEGYLTRFGPQLAELESLTVLRDFLGDYSLLPNLKSLYEFSPAQRLSLPPTLTRLNCNKSFSFSMLPSSITELEVSHLRNDLSLDETSESSAFSKIGLLKLTVQEKLSVLALERLPVTIEYLNVNLERDNIENTASKDLGCDGSWRVIATRFVNLKHLALRDCRVLPVARLEVVLSPCLETLELMQLSNGWTMMKWLEALCDDCNMDGRPRILPPSLKTFQIEAVGSAVFPVSVVPMLPRSLTTFILRGEMAHLHAPIFSSSGPFGPLLPNFPFNKNLTPTQHLEHFPPNLKQFRWRFNDRPKHGPLKMHIDSLQYLPQSLEILDLNNPNFSIEAPDHLIDNGSIGNFQAIARKLPPALSFISYGVLSPEACLEAYLDVKASEGGPKAALFPR